MNGTLTSPTALRRLRGVATAGHYASVIGRTNLSSGQVGWISFEEVPGGSVSGTYAAGQGIVGEYEDPIANHRMTMYITTVMRDSARWKGSRAAARESRDTMRHFYSRG